MAQTKTLRWTIERVKAELPDIPTTAGLGHVRGRKLPFAGVFIDITPQTTVAVEAAWGAIAHCLNTGESLHV